MKFCSHCGQPVALKIPAGDTLPRHVCDACDTIHYQNPRMVVGCIAEWEDRILLCKRAIHPRLGFWTVPAGFMENGETTQAGAARETLEEANARVDDLSLYALYNIPHINQVYILFRARLLDLDFHPGTESLETKLVAEADIPWNELAFATVRDTLRHYYSDRRKGQYGVHLGTIEPMGDRIAPRAAAPVTRDS
ncbi:MAG: NUDIX domain-containing protein [Gemmatimonadaceae bacterium]|nr:NUDIX domain-containing protein [Gemmatimonadaceae bacterium]